MKEEVQEKDEEKNIIENKQMKKEICIYPTRMSRGGCDIR